MQYTLKAPAQLNSTVKLPASKSISNRALIISALSGNIVNPQNLSDCDDTNVTVRALRDMPYEIDIMASGTAMRFMTAYLSVTEGEHVLTGTERMKHRPIKILVDALRYLGADIEYLGEEGYPPLRIRGSKIDGGAIEVPGDMSSQYISALLMIGPVLENGLELTLTGDIISRSYIDLTLHTMHDFGAKVDWKDIKTIKAEPGGYRQRDYLIENDWSAASYWYEMLAIHNHPGDEVKLLGLADASRQGDSVVKYLFSMLGVKTMFESTEAGVPTTVTLKKVQKRLPRLDYDFKNQPDLAQTFVVSCCAMNIPFHFVGLSTLKIKETDRIQALKAEMRKLGYIITDRDESELMWNGERCDPTWEPIDTYEDHRMALSFAPLCFIHKGLRINNPHVVTKSYPRFWDDLKEAGFEVSEE
jgi:3-phosphoshikimate 1-carboxyvinyltransferase